jgi:hypothetical protein
MYSNFSERNVIIMLQISQLPSSLFIKKHISLTNYLFHYMCNVKIINRWLEHFISVLDLQLALTAISLPFIIGWGLPISIIAVAGNLLFGPFLTAFLLLASLLFVTQLFHIPNGLFVVLLEWCTVLWSKVLSFTSAAFLVSVPTVRPWCLAVLFLAACLILCFRMSKRRRLLLYTVFLIGVLGALKLYAYFDHATLTVKQGSKCLTFVKTSDQLMCIDSGIRASRGLKSWFFYTVLPEMRKQLGTTTITAYVALRPNKATPELCRLFDLGPGTSMITPDDELLHVYAAEHCLNMQAVADNRCLSVMLGKHYMVTVRPLEIMTGCYAELHNNQFNHIILPRLTRSERNAYTLTCC